MITCGRCQTQNLDGSQFCDDCGAALHQSSTTSLGRLSGLAGMTGNYRLPPEMEEQTRVRAEPAPVPPAPVSAPRQVAPLPLPEPSGHAAMRPEPLPPPRHSGTSAMSGPVVAPPLAAPASRPADERNVIHAKLVIERGRSAGKQFPLHSEDAGIGRWDADGGIFPDVDLDADDPEAKVSRKHARILRRNGQYYIEDVGSTNGTFINRGRRLLPGDRHPLQDGDELIVGKMFLRFYVVK